MFEVRYSTVIAIVVFIIALIIEIVAGVKFNEIAKLKGWDGYLWWCILLGPAGWAMVIALPDRGITPRDQAASTMSSYNDLPNL